MVIEIFIILISNICTESQICIVIKLEDFFYYFFFIELSTSNMIHGFVQFLPGYLKLA